MEMNSYARAQMEQSSWQDEVKKSEHPHQFRTYPIKEEEISVVFKEKRTGLFPQMNNQRNTMKPETIIVVFLEIVFVVVTFNNGSNFMCHQTAQPSKSSDQGQEGFLA